MRRNHLNVRSCRGLPSELRTHRMSASHPQIECVEKQSVEFAAASPAHQPWLQPCGLPSSASRVAGENGPSVRRAFGHAASPRRRTRHPGLPASRARPSPAAPPDCALVCFAGKTIPPLHPPPASGRAVCLLGSGKPTVKTHTHERGSISSGWPPNQPASRIAKLFGKGGARGGVSPVIDGAPVVGGAPGKLLRPASRRLRRP